LSNRQSPEPGDEQDEMSILGLPFYLKDPDNEYETYEFDVGKGEVNFHPDVNKSDAPELEEKTQCYCNECAWNGKFGNLK